ncbi:YqjK-like protein [Modicisalibacter ilicicola DSM 19980]|uniref:YqjK-like protein n=1 Tax=Modicisalibacter ilicicola DSM 19980 TaxID=1121942 RepID=A0A1M4YH10_9GAMM|nr:YqjK-like family protein [Halomonas ilicicola]SHF05104.1 YqjK-like protein [Halomonas ilicicola DSM 19980]
MTHRDRLRRREELETQILQQRIDMALALRDWREATAPIDRGWQRLTQWRTVFYALGGLAAIRGVRKPRSTGKLMGKLLTGALLANRLRVAYRLLRRNRP